VEVVKDVETENKQLKEKLQEKNEYISKLEAKLEKMEAKLEAKLEKLESTVTTIALEAKTVSAKPVTTNNTTNHITVTTNTNNFLNLSKEHVNKVLKDNMDCRLGDVCRREDIDGFRWEVDVLLRRSESPDV
jgi:predicted nuclease with TOPRIM domain